MTGREFLERYGVSLAVVALLALVIAILPDHAQQVASDVSGSGSGSGIIEPSTTSGPLETFGPTTSGGSGVAAPQATASGGGQAPSVAAGFDIKSLYGKGSCRSDGRQAGITVYMPPCLEYKGSNGGATARGVTKDKIKVVRYLGQLDPGTQAILQSAGLSDAENIRAGDYNALLKYANQHYYTYGREVVFETLNASGPSNSDEAMKADAIKIANDIKAFAVIEGSPDAGIPKVLAQELAQRGVICICTASLSSQFYNENPPYIFSSLPTSDEYAQQIAEYIGKRLKGKKAEFAGDDVLATQGFRNQTRKFGLIYIEGSLGRVDPEGKRARDLLVKEMAKYGLKFAAESAYIYEGGRNADTVTNMVAQMKAAGVTTVVPLADPLYPILFTQEATRQGYFPEWFITGSGLSDTTTAGRLYDQLQWRHAFGISPLWVTWKTVAKSGGYRSRQHGIAAASNQTGVLVAIYASYFGVFFTGVQLAGPTLTADTFVKGMYAFPPTGGKPAAPLVFWTRQYPTADKDFVEVWYDYNRQGPDERGANSNGMIEKTNGAKRYRPGQWTPTGSKVFVEDGSELDVSDDPPGGGDFPHEQDGHHHEGACLSCPGFKTIK